MELFLESILSVGKGRGATYVPEISLGRHHGCSGWLRVDFWTGKYPHGCRDVEMGVDVGVDCKWDVATDWSVWHSIQLLDHYSNGIYLYI